MLPIRRLSTLVLAFVLFFAIATLVSAQGTTVVVTESATLGSILTDGDGLTLYVFGRDTPGTSNCYDACAGNWPPVTVGAGETPAGGAGVTGALAVTDRTTGERQVTYNGMPLYYFANDAAPGDTTGQGVGDVWYVVPPAATTYDEAVQMSQAGAGATQQVAPTATPASPAALPTTGQGNTSTQTTLILMGVGLLLIVSTFALRRRQVS